MGRERERERERVEKIGRDGLLFGLSIPYFVQVALSIVMANLKV